MIMTHPLPSSQIRGHAPALGLFLAAAFSFTHPNLLAENWPQFRGPRGDGTSLETNVPVHWSATRNLVWKSPLPGEGHSSPVVWGDSLFITSADKTSGRRHLHRFDALTGKPLWQRTVVTAPADAMHRENSHASSTPATDGTRVFTSFQAGDRVDLRCFDFEGNQLWAMQPLAFEGEHGYSYSPVLYNNLLLFDCRQEGEATLLALDPHTGGIRWRAEPENKRISHVSPLLITHGSQHQMVVCGSDEIRGYNPDTGQPLWWCQGPSDVAVAGLAHGDGMVFATAGYPVRTRMAVRTGGRGDVTTSHVAWSFKRHATYVPSPVYTQGHLYSVLDDGMLYCFDARTGEPKWEERLGGRFRSSLVMAEGRLYATSDKGLTTVFKADPGGYQPVATNSLGEFCYATPAVSGGRMFLRTDQHLYCIGTNRPTE
jgi:outer membrane protein assembly factor BamB